MERRGESIVIALFLGFIAHLIALANAQGTTKLLTNTCNKTPNPNLCVSTLSSHPQTIEAKHESDLAIIMVGYVNYTAVETIDHISDFIQDPKVDESTKQLLKKCGEQYNQLIAQSLTATVDGLYAKNYAKARDSMKAVSVNAESCEASFKAPVKSPISADSQAMNDLSKISLAIVSLLA